MFERFTDRARRVVVLAQEEARLLNPQLVHEILHGTRIRRVSGLGLGDPRVRLAVPRLIHGDGAVVLREEVEVEYKVAPRACPCPRAME